MPVLYNKIDYSKLTIDKPVKHQDNIRKCKISYDDIPFIVQTCKKIKVSPETLTFSLNKKGHFYSCIDDIKNNVIDILSKGDYFKKSFTRESIQKAFSPVVYVNDQGDGEIPVDTCDTKWIDIFSQEIVKSYETNSSCLLYFKNVVFLKNTVALELKLISVKLDSTITTTQQSFNGYLLEDPEPETQDNTDIIKDTFDEHDEHDEHDTTDTADTRGSTGEPCIVEETVAGDLTDTEDFFCD